MHRKRGPYKNYLNDGSNAEIPARTRRRRMAALEALQARQNNIFQAPEFETNESIFNMDANARNTFRGEEIQQNVAENITMISDEEDVQAPNIESGRISSSSSDSELEYSEDYSDAEYAELHSSQPFESLISYLKKHANITEFKINFTVAEIMFLLITFALVHNLTLTAMCDLMNLFNVLCGLQILPSTRYYFKKYFNPSFGMQIHYACDFCGHYLGRKCDDEFNSEENCFICNCCKNENKIEGYKYDNTFVTVNIAKQIKELLENPSVKFNFDFPIEDDIFRDINSGLMYKRNIPDCDGIPIKYITFTFNSDASPVSKDGKTKINPIYLMINEIDYRDRAKHLILAGVMYGKTLVRNDIFLKPFVEQLNSLGRGINVNLNGVITKIKMVGLCCCVDSIARPPMQGIKSVGGYFCCSWCLIKGEGVATKGKKIVVKYPSNDKVIVPRTESSFRSCVKKLVQGEQDIDLLKGINFVSPLFKLDNFSMVWSFTPDIMHLVFIGIVYRFLGIWFYDSNFEGYIGGPLKVKYFDNMLKKIQIPTFIKKDPLPLSDRKIWKSKHLENWFLFYSVPLLKGNLPRKYFNHWKLLVEAINLLLQDCVSGDQIEQAEILLNEFVAKTEELYGKYEMTYNMHQLCHLAESARRFGPLWTHTAYPYESGIGYLKSILKASKGIPQQIIRSIELGRASLEIYKNFEIDAKILNLCEILQEYRHTKVVRSDINECFLGPPKAYNETVDNLPSDLQFDEFSKAIKDGITYTKFDDSKVNRKDDSYVELFDGQFAQIKNILCSKTQPKISYVIITKIIFEDEPYLTHTKRILDKGQTIACKFSDIKCVAVRIAIDEYNDYLCTIPIKHYTLNM